jgi:hypothetical protein
MVIKRDADGEIIDENPSVECVTYIMSREMKAEEFACYARGHWGVLSRQIYYPDFSPKLAPTGFPA